LWCFGVVVQFAQMLIIPPLPKGERKFAFFISSFYLFSHA
jgi:hypothetical protein